MTGRRQLQVKVGERKREAEQNKKSNFGMEEKRREEKLFRVPRVLWTAVGCFLFRKLFCSPFSCFFLSKFSTVLMMDWWSGCMYWVGCKLWRNYHENRNGW